MRITVQMITNLQESIKTMGEQFNKERPLTVLDSLKSQVHHLSPKQIEMFKEICVETACKQPGNFMHVNMKREDVKGLRYS